ncbi:MAG: GTPase [Miltoncostaeaceae bacterium]|nr:GTPase [Miltoncostaeaceae bacterium]
MNEIQRTYRGSAARTADQERLEGPRGPERAIAIASIARPLEEELRLGELRELLRTAGADVIASLVQRRDRPDPRTYLGKGRLEELELLVEDTKANLVAAEGELTAGQQRTLEDRLKTRVVDRTGLILDIFAQHARSAEGKLQVELAQLEYSYSRQEGLWQHLERLGGGIGTRGPGETQLESDRRILRTRMGALRRRLREVARSRDVMRGRRLASDLPRIALAGYTNAGKSSLMNALTGADVAVNDALFETLDPTTRAFEHNGMRFLVSDTVCYIRGLPHELVDAFKATLEETRDAQLILHVADASEPDERQEIQARAVDEVLEEIGAGEVPRLLVLNKFDRLDEEERADLASRHPTAIPVSATTGLGLDVLRGRLATFARTQLVRLELTVPYTEGRLLAEIHAAGSEVRQQPEEDGTRVSALMPAREAARIRSALAALDGGAGKG